MPDSRSTLGTAGHPRQYLAKSFVLDTEPLMPSNMPRFRKLMGVATIFYLLAATLFIAKVVGDLPNVLVL